jgi:hypothetical protein
MPEVKDEQQSNNEWRDKIIASHVSQLAEHFDTVQVFCTRHESDDVGTYVHSKGSGNWCARFGQVKEWYVKQEEDARIDQHHYRDE